MRRRSPTTRTTSRDRKERLRHPDTRPGHSLAGIALGAAAALEIPALLLIGQLNRHVSSLALILVGCLAGIAYYLAMARPGLASGLYTNTRRLGAIVSGPIIALGSLALGYAPCSSRPPHSQASLFSSSPF